MTDAVGYTPLHTDAPEMQNRLRLVTKVLGALEGEPMNGYDLMAIVHAMLINTQTCPICANEWLKKVAFDYGVRNIGDDDAMALICGYHGSILSRAKAVRQ